jgi:hypothetical protein
MVGPTLSTVRKTPTPLVLLRTGDQELLMPSKSMTRKDFFKLTFTLVGGAAALAPACGSSSNTSGTGGSGAGTGGSGTGTGGSGAGTGGAGGSSAQCTNPLPEMQLPDATGHEHTLVVGAALLAATSPITLQTAGFPVGSGGHVHDVTLTVSHLAMLKAGGSVMVPSSSAGTTPHIHTYMVSCT